MSQRLYRFLNHEGDLLYIGRTENIKRRIHNQHFDKKPMPCLAFGGYEEVYKVECTNEMSDLEAVLLEAGMIRKNSPKYNIEFNSEDCLLSFVNEFIKKSEIDKVEWGFYSWNPRKPVDNQMRLFEDEAIKENEEKGIYIY